MSAPHTRRLHWYAPIYCISITGWTKKAVHIHKEGHRAMNRDEGSYQLSHTYVAVCVTENQANENK